MGRSAASSRAPARAPPPSSRRRRGGGRARRSPRAASREAADEALRTDDADLRSADVDRRPAPVEDRDPRRFQDAGDLVLAVRVPVVVPEDGDYGTSSEATASTRTAACSGSPHVRRQVAREKHEVDVPVEAGEGLLRSPRREGERWISPADATRIGTAPILPPPPEAAKAGDRAALWKVQHLTAPTGHISRHPAPVS